MHTAVIALRQSFWPLICAFCFYEPPVQTPLKTHTASLQFSYFCFSIQKAFETNPLLQSVVSTLTRQNIFTCITQWDFHSGWWSSEDQTRTGDDKKQNTTLLDGLLLRKGAGQIRCMSAHLLTEAPLDSPTMFSCGVGEIAFISQIPVLASLANSLWQT